MLTKEMLQEFCLQKGWIYNYSGKSGGVYIDPKDKLITIDNIECAIVQHFGIFPDFSIFRS
jgi:hypothetical protein